MKDPHDRLEAMVSELVARKEHTGDEEALRAGLRGSIQGCSSGDAYVHVAFQPANPETFEDAVEQKLGGAIGITRGARSGPGVQSESAGPRIILFSHLPGGVAHLPFPLFRRILDEGMIRSFAWEPSIRFNGTPPPSSGHTPLSVVNDPPGEQRLRNEGICSALDLVSKTTHAGNLSALAKATGLSESALAALVKTAAENLTDEERNIVAHPPPFPFVPGIPMEGR